MQAKDICLLAAQQAKAPGMVAIAGQWLNVVLDDLKKNRDLKVNRVTQTLQVQAGSFGPFALEADYLRTYDMFYFLPGSDGLPQFLTPCTMEQFDGEVKTISNGDYPYEFATDLSSQAQNLVNLPGTVTAVPIIDPGFGYWTLPNIVFPAGVGSGATATPRLGAAGSIGAWALGSGYLPNEIVTLVGGIFDRPCTIRLVLQPGQAYEVVDPGSYSVVPGQQTTVSSSGGLVNATGVLGTIPVTGGSGTGLQLLMVWSLASVTVNSVGNNYSQSAPQTPTAVGGVPGAIPPNKVATLGVTIAPAANSGSAGNLYVYPQSPVLLPITHRYMVNQPDIINPETSTVTPWFSFTDYLIQATSARMMGISDDDRRKGLLEECERILRPHLIMQGDEQRTVQAVQLDPRHFKTNRGLRPTKAQPF